MLIEAVFSLLIGNPMLFFLYDSLAADNPQVKYEWVPVRGMCGDSASRLLLSSSLHGSKPATSSLLWQVEAGLVRASHY